MILRHPSKQPDRRVARGGDQIFMGPGLRRIVKNSRPQIAGGVDRVDSRAVHGKLQPSTRGLLQVMQLQLLTLSYQRHRLTSGLSRKADAGKTVNAIAG